MDEEILAIFFQLAFPGCRLGGSFEWRYICWSENNSCRLQGSLLPKTAFRPVPIAVDWDWRAWVVGMSVIARPAFQRFLLAGDGNLQFSHINRLLTSATDWDWGAWVVGMTVIARPAFQRFLLAGRGNLQLSHINRLLTRKRSPVGWIEHSNYPYETQLPEKYCGKTWCCGCIWRELQA